MTAIHGVVMVVSKITNAVMESCALNANVPRKISPTPINELITVATLRRSRGMMAWRWRRVRWSRMAPWPAVGAPRQMMIGTKYHTGDAATRLSTYGALMFVNAVAVAAPITAGRNELTNRPTVAELITC